jgi:hypothetical protein
MSETTKRLTPEERRKIIEAPLGIRVVGHGPAWGGETRFAHGDGRRPKTPTSTTTLFAPRRTPWTK